tara:strand:+ start:103 stop:336 length:234 start_codon:yes stop_codon:yes gene_type:complete
MIRTRTRSSSTVPFGWATQEDNEHILIENTDEQGVLKDLHKMKEAQSLRSMAKFVKAKTGRSLTPRGVSKILSRGYT